MTEKSTALVVPGMAGLAPREVIQRAEAQITEAHALLKTDLFAGLAKATKVQKAMKIYARVCTEAKATGRIGNMATATRLKAERVAGEALQSIERERGKAAGRGRNRSSHDGTTYRKAITEVGITHNTADRWQTVAEVPPAQFDAYVAQVERERELTTSELLRAHMAEINRHARTEKLDLIARGGQPLALPQRYPVLYVDPPWRYEHVKTESRAIENQYPTMDLEEICALPVAANATDDAILFLWATSPKLAEAFDVLAAWDFTYRTSMIWVKPQIGMGYWARQQHELLLIATKGEPPTPAPADRPGSVITAKRGAHSDKPGEFYEVIERMFPTLPKVELFARRPRAGWERWGNQSAQ